MDSSLLLKTKGLILQLVMGDSNIIIDWIKYINSLSIIQLRPRMEKITGIINILLGIRFEHVYRERNQLVDDLSKDDVHVQER